MKVSPSSTANNTDPSKSVLMIGASGRTGIHIIQALAAKDIEITAFCRDPSKLSEGIQQLCNHVVTGNARNQDDLQNALKVSNADTVIIAIGNGDDVSKTDIRTKSAQALATVLSTNPQFQHTRVVVVSSVGAGNSKIKVGFGMGQMIEFHLRHILNDHDGQELAFQSLKERVMIIRPTGLTDDDIAKAVKMVTFGNNEKSPTNQTYRRDLAEWIVTQIIHHDVVSFGSNPINVTCMFA
jgi:putative NADH-flavin reductase